MANKRTSASDKSHHLTYKTQQIWAKNRKIKLERALKKNPENKQIEVALKSISYRRKTPTTQVWNHTNKAMAQLIKQISGFCDKNIFHPNKDIREIAYRNILAKQVKIPSTLNNTTKGLFSIKERAHNKGVYLWA